MARAARKLFRLLDDEVVRGLLECLLKEGPKTQQQLAAALKLNSSGVSRRMAALEEEGIVERASPRGPYHVVFPSTMRELLEKAAELAEQSAIALAKEAIEHREAMAKGGDEGVRLHEQAKEET